ncbi:MAG: MFS transporter [Pseudomonadota bacterium]
MASEKTSLWGALTPVAALLFGVALLYAGYGLQATLVPLRAQTEGFDNVVIGMLGSFYYLGFVVGCLFAPFVIIRAGHIRAFAAMVSCVSAATLAFPLAIGEVEWMVFRFAVGFCISGILVIVESWLNEKAGNETRGVVMSTYIIITYAMITVGQMGVTTLPLVGFGLFSFCSIILSLAAVPVALTRAGQPAPIPVVRFRPGLVFSLAPAAFAGTFASGIMTGSLFSLGAIYATESGFSTTNAALFISALVLGGALGQFPFGRVSDFFDRRMVLLVAMVGTLAISLTLVFGDAFSNNTIVVFALILGIFVFPGYSLAAAHAFDWTPYEDMVETSAGLILLFGIGSTIGPIVSSVAMEVMGPRGLFAVVALAAAGLVMFIVARVFIRDRPADDLRSDFDIYSTAPVGGAITPEPIAEDDPSLEVPVFPTPATEADAPKPDGQEDDQAPERTGGEAGPSTASPDPSNPRQAGP